VLLPTDWLKSHAPEQLRTVLAHELAHVANHDLHWLASSRALVMLLWAQPLLWLLRRRMRLDQESLADAAAAELTGRQRYAEQLVAWARRMPARSAVHLSAAVGLWEGPSQLRQRIALLLNEHLYVLRECSLRSRLASLTACALLALGLSFVTLQPAQTNAQDAESKRQGPLPTSADAAVKTDPAFIDDRFILCRIHTDLQRSLLGDVAEPAADASLCVFINYAAFAGEPLDSESSSFSALSDQLKRLAEDDNRYVLMRVMVAEVSIGSDFEQVQERAQALAKLCEDLGRAAGYKRAKWSTSYGGDEWKTFIDRASPISSVAESKDESSVGDEQVQVFPARTFLSRLLTNADCVVNFNPVVRHKDGTRFPDDFVPAMMKFVPQLEYDRKQTLLIRVRFAESAKDRLDEWVNDRSARETLAKQFGFEKCNLRQSFTNEPEKAADDGATGATAAAKPVDIPILVAKHVMLHEGKIIEWADLERMLQALPNSRLAQPQFYLTHGGFERGDTDVYGEILELRRKIPLRGHAIGSLQPRVSIRYDAVRTADDLVPNDAHRVAGTVETADGLPIDGVEVVLCTPVDPSIRDKTLKLYLRNGGLRNPIEEIVTKSDNSGRFVVYPTPDTPYYLVALHREGFGLVRSDTFVESKRVVLHRWACVKGRIQPGAPWQQSAIIMVRLSAEANWPEIRFYQYSEDLGPPSPDGQFEFAFVPPSLRGSLSRLVENAKGPTNSLPVKEFQLAPGETLTADIEPPSDAEVKQIDGLKSETEERLPESDANRATSAATSTAPATGSEKESQDHYTFPIKLSGRALDADGNPIVGAEVFVSSQLLFLTPRNQRLRAKPEVFANWPPTPWKMLVF